MAKTHCRASKKPFQENKYRKVLETLGCFLPCFHGNAHVGIQLARGVPIASCQAAGCGRSELSCLQPVFCREPHRDSSAGDQLASSCREAIQDAAAPGQRHTSQLRCSRRQGWHQLLKCCWIRGGNVLLQHRRLMQKIKNPLPSFSQEIPTFLIFSRD